MGLNYSIHQMRRYKNICPHIQLVGLHCKLYTLIDRHYTQWIDWKVRDCSTLCVIYYSVALLLNNLD